MRAAVCTLGIEAAIVDFFRYQSVAAAPEAHAAPGARSRHDYLCVQCQFYIGKVEIRTVP